MKKNILFFFLLLSSLALSARESYLGIYITLPSTYELRALGLTSGVKVETVMPGSPADVYGLQNNDIIYRINNTFIKSEFDLHQFLSITKPDDLVNVYVFSNQKLHLRQIKLAKTNSLLQDLYLFNYIQNPGLFIGITVEQISSKLADLLNLEAGMVILDIREKSIASLQGLEAGDIIISINNLPTNSEKSLIDALNIGLQTQIIPFHIWRDSKKIDLQIDLSNSLIKKDNAQLNEIYIIGPDIFDNTLYGYSKEKIRRILNKPKSEFESDIERLEEEIYQLRKKMDDN